MKKYTSAAETRKLIESYNYLIKGIENKANDDEERAYDGIIQAGKGILVENMAKKLVEIAWQELKGDINRLSLEKKTVKIPLQPDYLNRIEVAEVKEYITQNIADFYYTLKTDVHAYIDNEFVMAIECKAYTENAMLKRILVDFTLFKHIYPNLHCILFELESQLGGDYAEISKEIIYGSHSTHTLMSYFNVDLHIITLLEGERKVTAPIHKTPFFKELKTDSVLKAITLFKNLLKAYL